ncbi:MAG: DUF3592 domain-containing protein, partial [Candidatus Omnitrophica bacterium]|nr:DUF3592 domain-containing protein [Candidatus Omnitrophota bacterium]
YSPVLRFISQNNQVIETQATWRQADSFLDPKPEKGKTIVLLVNKSDPYSFTKKSFSSLWGWPAMLTFIGLGWLLGGIHMLLRAIKLKGQNS